MLRIARVAHADPQPPRVPQSTAQPQPRDEAPLPHGRALGDPRLQPMLRGPPDPHDDPARRIAGDPPGDDEPPPTPARTQPPQPRRALAEARRHGIDAVPQM